MTELENLIVKHIDELYADTTAAKKTFGSVKKALNVSAGAVKTVGNIGDSIHENIKESSEGKLGKVGGWMVGKTTKAVTGLGSGLIAGTIKTAAKIIPEAVSPKKPEIDASIARIVETYELPSEKTDLLETVKYLWENVYEKTSGFGDRTKKSMQTLHEEAYTMLITKAANDDRLLRIAKNYSSKKKSGMFG